MTETQMLILAIAIAGNVLAVKNPVWEFITDWRFYQNHIKKSIIARVLFFELIALTVAIPCIILSIPFLIAIAIITTDDRCDECEETD